MPEQITIILTNRAPIRVREDEWPVIAGGDDPIDASDGDTEPDELSLCVRQHSGGRAIVYGSRADHQGDRGWHGGELLDEGDDLAGAILRVGEDAGLPAHVIRECIADLPVEDLSGTPEVAPSATPPAAPGESQASAPTRTGRPKIVVKKYKGEAALQRGLTLMDRRGYDVDQQASRKALYALTTGIFTRKQIHTVTFRLRDDHVRAPSKKKHWWQEPTMRDVIEGRAERRENRGERQQRGRDV